MRLSLQANLKGVLDSLKTAGAAVKETERLVEELLPILKEAPKRELIIDHQALMAGWIGPQNWRLTALDGRKVRCICCDKIIPAKTVHVRWRVPRLPRFVGDAPTSRVRVWDFKVYNDPEMRSGHVECFHALAAQWLAASDLSFADRVAVRNSLSRRIPNGFTVLTGLIPEAYKESEKWRSGTLTHVGNK